MSSQTCSVHDIRNFAVSYDYPADLIINYRASRSQLYQQKLLENWKKESPKTFNYSLVCFSIYLNNIHTITLNFWTCP
jgi:hypothetical protein